MICPPVSNCATPRPATIRISVAMIGCMPTCATNSPFHTPHSAATASAAPIARLIGTWLTCVCTPSFTTSSPPIISAAPAASECEDLVHDLQLGGDVDAARRLVED